MRSPSFKLPAEFYSVTDDYSCLSPWDCLCPKTPILHGSCQLKTGAVVPSLQNTIQFSLSHFYRSHGERLDIFRRHITNATRFATSI